MDGSGTIRVLKRDGTVEEFNLLKLAAAMSRAMRCRAGRYRDAADLAGAIEIYLRRCSQECISSAAVFEMAVKVLRRVKMSEAAEAMETYRIARRWRRKHLKVTHDDNRVTYWDKGWLARLGGQSWMLMPTTARIIAAQVECELLESDLRLVSREVALEVFNQYVVRLGLADAVPVTMNDP